MSRLLREDQGFGRRYPASKTRESAFYSKLAITDLNSTHLRDQVKIPADRLSKGGKIPNMSGETLLQAGKPAPEFSLPDLDGAYHALTDFRGGIVIVNFWSAECPWSERADRIISPRLSSWNPAVSLLSIASNANETREEILQASDARGISPILLDSDQFVADIYHAKTTPHFFVIDANGVLRYQGAPDDSTFRQREVRNEYLVRATEALLAGKSPDPAQSLPYGCALVRYG